jgi:hypothetical protein
MASDQRGQQQPPRIPALTLSTVPPPPPPARHSAPAADRPDPAWAMAELWRCCYDPDMLSAEVARWAYDYIRQLEGAVVALGAPLPPLGHQATGGPAAHVGDVEPVDQ